MRLQGLYTGGARAVSRLDADWRWDALLSTAFIYLLDLIIICNHNILTTSPSVINETYHLYDQPCPGLKFMNDYFSINSKHHRILNFHIITTLIYFTFTQIGTNCADCTSNRTFKSIMHFMNEYAAIDIKPAWKAWGCESCLTSLPYLTEPYWVILGPSGSLLCHWALLSITGTYLALLSLTGSYWAFLGLVLHLRTDWLTN